MDIDTKHAAYAQGKHYVDDAYACMHPTHIMNRTMHTILQRIESPTHAKKKNLVSRCPSIFTILSHYIEDF